MIPDPIEAKCWSWLFGYGVATTTDVIQWADSEIAAMDEPPIALIDLAYCSPSDIGQIVTQLNVLSAGCDLMAAFRRTLGRLHDYLLLNPAETERISNGVFKALLEFPKGVPDEFNFIYRIDDAFFLAAHGIYGNVEKTRAEFMNELRLYIER